MTATQLSEASLLLIPTFMEIMEKHSGLVQTIITPADSYLKAVYDDMDATIEASASDTASSTQLLLNKKFGNWIIKLEQAKTILRTVGAEHGLYLKGYGTTSDLNTADISRAMERIDRTLTALEDFISSKTMDPDTGEEKVEYGDQAISLANNYLLALIGKSSVFALNMFDRGAAANTLAGLRAIETLLVRQIELDKREYILAQNLLTAIETLPTFSLIKRQIDNTLSQLSTGNSEVAKQLVNQVRHGDLSGLASYLDVASFATGTTSCLAEHYLEKGGKDESVLTRIQDSLSTAGVSVSQQLGISSAISGLKKKYAMIKEMTRIIDLEATNNG